MARSRAPGAWYCAIDDYQKFAVPVPAKVDGRNREVIATNLWRDGVRRLDPEVYAAILAEAAIAPDAPHAPAAAGTAPQPAG